MAGRVVAATRLRDSSLTCSSRRDVGFDSVVPELFFAIFFLFSIILLSYSLRVACLGCRELSLSH